MKQLKKIKKNCNKVLLNNDEEDYPIENEAENKPINLSIYKEHQILSKINMDNENIPDEGNNDSQGTPKIYKNTHFKKKLDMKRKFQHLERIELEKMQDKTIYDENELNSLKLMNQSQNNTAKELMNQLINENQMEIEEKNEEDVINEEEKEIYINNSDNEEGGLEEFEKEQVEQAKKKRENKRRISSGEYIPLQNRDKDFFEKTEKERIYMSGVRKDEDRIKKEFLEEEKLQKQKKFSIRLLEEEEDDEFQKYEKKLLNKVVKTKNIAQHLIVNHDDIVNDQSGNIKEIQALPQMKVKYSLDDVSIEYINSFMDENAKTIEKELESTREKLEKLQKSNAETESMLTSSKTQIQQFAENFLESQKNLEFWTEYSDMINEKTEEILNAKSKLSDLKSKYAEKTIGNQLEELNDYYIETDGIGMPNYSEKNPMENINLHSAKIDSRLKILSKSEKKTKRNKNHADEINYDSYMSSDDSDDEGYDDMVKAKGEFYEAVDDIMREIEDEFKAIPLILKKFEQLQQSIKMDENKAKDWLFDVIKPFFEIDLLKYDPFGKTERFFPYYKVSDVLKLENIEKVIKISQENQGKYERIIEILWENLIFAKLQEIIVKEWDVYSKEENQILKQIINQFIENTYLKDTTRLQRNLTIIQTILTEIIEKIYKSQSLCIIPNNINTIFGKNQIYRNLRIMANVMKLTDFLPISNVIEITFDNLMNETFFAKIQNLELRSKIAISQKIFSSIEPKVLKNEKAQKWTMYFSYFLNLILHEIEATKNEAFLPDKERIYRILNEIQGKAEN